MMNNKIFDSKKNIMGLNRAGQGETVNPFHNVSRAYLLQIKRG
jgi:hypothetical protein